MERKRKTHRFVEENEESRLGGELDGDSQTLALLDVESHADLSDDSLCVGVHLEEGDDLLDVLELFSLGNRSRLTKTSREDEGLANGGSGEMSVLLLACKVAREQSADVGTRSNSERRTVTGLTLEGDREGLAVNEHVAGNDAGGDALGKDVK